MKPRHAILLVVGVLAIASMLIVSNCSRVGETTQTGDVLTYYVSTANADAEVTYTIALTEGTDAVHESAHIFEAVESQAIEKAELNVSALTLTIYYDSSAITEDELVARLAQTGYPPR